MDRSVTLRAGASLLAAVAFVGADDFVLHHPKNPNAPLQPPSVEDVAVRIATPSPTAPPKSTGAPTTPPKGTAAPRGTPPAKITLQPGVRATELPGITYTHVS
jgi:hypothetical protein